MLLIGYSLVMEHPIPRHPLLLHVYGAYKKEAIRRGYAFRLTRAEVNLFMQQICYYCGRPPSARIKKYPDSPYNGIDRVDNGKGYYWENCVTCCRRCNTIKRACPIAIAQKMTLFMGNGYVRPTTELPVRYRGYAPRPIRQRRPSTPPRPFGR